MKTSYDPGITGLLKAVPQASIAIWEKKNMAPGCTLSRSVREIEELDNKKRRFWIKKTMLEYFSVDWGWVLLIPSIATLLIFGAIWTPSLQLIKELFFLSPTVILCLWLLKIMVKKPLVRVEKQLEACEGERVDLFRNIVKFQEAVHEFTRGMENSALQPWNLKEVIVYSVLKAEAKLKLTRERAFNKVCDRQPRHLNEVIVAAHELQDQEEVFDRLWTAAFFFGFSIGTRQGTFDAAKAELASERLVPTD